MTEPVVIIGVGADGLPGMDPEAVTAVRSATFLAGGRRHLELVGPTAAECFRITDNVDELVSRLARRGPAEVCVVLASGDPLFYGIGHRLTRTLGVGSVRVMPHLSSMQIAFGRVGISWQDAAVASVHGRALKPVLLPLLGRQTIGLFTRDGDGPSEVAGFFVERGLVDYDAWVCENLGSDREHVIPSTVLDLVGRRFAGLNVLVLRRHGGHAEAVRPNEVSEIADDSFARPASGSILLTHQDVRSLVLRRFRGCGDGPLWDIGAGLGGVSVELARAFPGVEVVAVERSHEQAGYLRTNRARFGAYNIRVVEGEAPYCLDGEDGPSGVFLGGSGGKLDAILDLVVGRVRPGGRLVANFVGLENLTALLEWTRRLGWETDLCQVSLCEGRPLAGLTTLVPRRPVWVVRADAPGVNPL